MTKNGLISSSNVRLATGLYRQILIYININMNISDIKRNYMRTYVRLRFEANREQKSVTRIKKAFRDGWAVLISLKKAVAGDLRSYEKILEWTYGRRGKRKHQLLRPLLSSLRTGDPTISKISRTRLPVLSAPIEALIRSQMPNRAISFGSNTILDRKRKANFCWKEFSSIYRKILPPLPLKEIKHLEKLSQGEGITSAKFLSFRKQPSEIPNSTIPHHITLRFQRRLYQRLLMKCPRLVYKIDTGWIVEWSKKVPSKNMRTNSIHQDMFLIQENNIKIDPKAW
ncbi:hypothetical protein PCANB_000955 [Pneumocystis canis]|nr:hypothetical protein PCANB_000955 [Pneumocystis canis]